MSCRKQQCTGVPRSYAKGFTLAEVLMALAILSVAFLAMIKMGGTHTSNAMYLRDKTFAHWVAMNKLTELQIKREFPKIGESEGVMVMGQHEWFWQQTVSSTPRSELRRVDVMVKPDKKSDQILTALVGFSPEFIDQNTSPRR